MNYYCLFVGFQQLLVIHLCMCSKLHRQLPGAFNGYKNNNRSLANRCCERAQAYTQILELLLRSSCELLPPGNKTDENNRIRRDITGGSIDVHSLQSTVNDHRVMIEYLINNSINTTYLAQAINNYHSRTGPVWSSWRDWINLVLLGLIIIVIIYLLLCRAGFAPCDKALSFLFRPIIARLHQQEQQLQQRYQTPVLPTITARTISQNRARPRSPITMPLGDD